MPAAFARSTKAPVSTVASIRPFCSAVKRSRLPPAAHQHDTFLVDAPVPERGGNDDLIQSDDGQDADFFAAQLLWRADAWPSDYAVSVFVEISSDNDDIGAGKIRGDMRLRRDNVELYLAAGQRVGRFRATAEKNRL